jgi:hypothetical protein
MAEQQPWWRTLLGVLAALAAAITALTGLVVAIAPLLGGQGQPATTRSTPDASKDQVPSPQAAPNGGQDSPAIVASRPLPSSVAQLPAGMELQLDGGRVVLSVLSARLEPFNSDESVLRFVFRFTNGTDAFERSYYLTWRLVADGTSLAPLDTLYEQIDAHSAKKLEYAFRIPRSTQRAILKVTRAEQVVELPFDLTGVAR